MASDPVRLPARAASIFAEASAEIAAFSRLTDDQASPLVRCLTYLLRHGARAAGLVIDAEGWADLGRTAKVLGSMDRRLRTTSARSIAELVRDREPERFEVLGGRIRALYGHSLPGVVAARRADPPPRLFHGTAARLESAIRDSGLRPIGRCFVHLTSDLGYAAQVARSNGDTWLVLRIHARLSAEAGTEFRTAAGHVWLTSSIHPEFIDPLPVARG